MDHKKVMASLNKWTLRKRFFPKILPGVVSKFQIIKQFKTELSRKSKKSSFEKVNYIDHVQFRDLFKGLPDAGEWKLTLCPTLLKITNLMLSDWTLNTCFLQRSSLASNSVFNAKVREKLTEFLSQIDF